MKNSIVIVGCGATGSNIATFVSQLAISESKIEEIVLVDGDVVERKNFINQKFTERDIGKNKARVLSNRFSKLGIKISYIDKYLENVEELIKIIQSLTGQVILVGSVDNNKARRIMDTVFKSKEVPTLIYIDTGNGDKERVGQTVLGAKCDNKIIKPPVSEYFPQILVEEKEKPKKISYKCSAIEEHPQNLATNIMSATTTFMMINNIISFNKCIRTFVNFDAEKIMMNSR